MAQSLVKNYLHVIFSTKHRLPLIDEYIEKELHSYLAGICKDLECPPVKIGGYYDHVHIFCLMSKKIAVMKFLQELKANSSGWIKGKGSQYQNFYWQDGYGAFSVSHSEVEIVRTYIERQHEHHKIKTFQDEFREFLNRYEIEYDERYVWD
jgi:putative transposase